MLLETISAFGVATSRQKTFVYTKFLAAAILQCSTFQVFPTVFSYLLTPNAWLSGRDRLSQSPLPIHYIRSSTEQSQFLSFSITRRSVEGEFHLTKISLFYTSAIGYRFVWVFYSSVGFQCYFTVPLLNFSKNNKFSKAIDKSRATSWVTLRKGSQISFKSRYCTLKDKTKQQSTNSCWSERLKIDRDQNKFPWCISLVEPVTVIRARACAKPWKCPLVNKPQYYLFEKCAEVPVTC